MPISVMKVYLAFEDAPTSSTHRQKMVDQPRNVGWLRLETACVDPRTVHLKPLPRIDAQKMLTLPAGTIRYAATLRATIRVWVRKICQISASKTISPCPDIARATSGVRSGRSS